MWSKYIFDPYRIYDLIKAHRKLQYKRTYVWRWVRSSRWIHQDCLQNSLKRWTMWKRIEWSELLLSSHQLCLFFALINQSDCIEILGGSRECLVWITILTKRNLDALQSFFIDGNLLVNIDETELMVFEITQGCVTRS